MVFHIVSSFSNFTHVMLEICMQCVFRLKLACVLENFQMQIKAIEIVDALGNC
jgi:hypothetical protein